MLGSFPMHGFCSIDLSREFAWRWSLLSRYATSALSHGDPRSDLEDHLERCQWKRDWHIYAYFAQVLFHEARSLYANDAFMLELEETIYALDSTTIDLCLSLFPWGHFRKRKAAVKLHTLLDLRCNISTFKEITDGRVHDVNILDSLVPEAGSFYVMDRAYLDFQRLHQLHLELAYFIIRAKTNLQFTRMYSRPVDKASVYRCIRQSNSRDSIPPNSIRRKSGESKFTTSKKINTWLF